VTDRTGAGVQLRAQSPINQPVSLKHLTSKLLAGGLTAGIVLIWWPTQFPTTGIEALVARGILATLGFELMLLAFAGVEDRAIARLSRRSPRVARLRARAATAPRQARTGFVLAAGGVALVVPVLALASSGGPRVPLAQAAAPAQVVQPVRERVVRQVVVKRRVIHDEVVVPAPSTPVASAAPASAPAAAKPTTSTAREPIRDADRTRAKPSAPVQKTAPAPATTTPAPATTTTPAATPTVDADAATAAVEPVAP
jgi:hypothetical protein